MKKIIMCLITAAAAAVCAAAGAVKVPAGFAKGQWRTAGDIKMKLSASGVTVQDGLLFNDGQYADAEYSYRMRAPEGSKEVQAWVSFRIKDRWNRYTVGLRGGNNNILYMARYADDANARFLGFAPLEFQPKVGEWYDLRVVTVGKVIHVYINGEDKPRLVIEDDTALWDKGAIGVGESYLPAEFSKAEVRLLDAGEAAAIAKVKSPKQAYEPWKPSADKAKKRAEDRAAYKPVEVSDLSAPRTEVSLDGKWLFMPTHELEKDAQPVGLDADDSAWHTMNVPDMWVPPLAWLHGETGFPYLQEPARGKTAADKLRISEIKRVLGFTFDWDKTKAAWYRNYLYLPSDISGKRFELDFDAIATISRIFVNGTQVGSHIGMFGDIKCDITKYVKPGKNVITVEAVRELPKKSTNKTFEVAVTVEITEDMVNSLPKAFYNFSPAGIWQPAKLVVTNPVSIRDVFVKPALDSAVFEVEIANDGKAPRTVDVSYTVAPKRERSILYSKKNDQSVTVNPGETRKIEIKTPKLEPRLWTPSEPNLYSVSVRLSENGKAVDSVSETFGFRTFGVEGNRVMLNGHPYWLRGANHYPHAARANDRELARKFLSLAKENNVNVGRLHVGPVTEAWADAADEVGFIFSVEGIWPWLMLKKGEIPAENLLEAWRNDWASIVKKYRNHPGIGYWTVNNEMKFSIFDKGDKEMLKKKWAIVDAMIRKMREIDPTRPIVADSGYVRKEGSYQDYLDVVKANNFDDGDFDDIHRYHGWYNESFMHFMNGNFARNQSLPDRPFISQEMSTGYCNEDDGLPSRVYLFNHYTPQALIGDYAFEHNDPNYFLERQSFMTKELGEMFRRMNRDNMAGVLHFGFVTWFKDSHFKDSIEPRLGVKNLKKFLSPVLVSLELFGRHFYSGEEIARDLYVVNDSEDFKAIPPSVLTWQVVESGGKVLASGKENIGAVEYYANEKVPLKIKLPAVKGRADAKIVLKLEADGKLLSENDYDVVIASRDWARDAGSAKSASVALFDPSGEYAPLLSGFAVKKMESASQLSGAKVAVIADLGAFMRTKDAQAKLEKFVKDGGGLLLLNPGRAAMDWKGGSLASPEKVRGRIQIRGEGGELSAYREQRGEIVVPKIPESAAFDGLKPMDLAWFADEGSRDVPLASTAIFQIDRKNPNVRELAEEIQIHAYLNKPSDVLQYSGSPLLEIDDGKGRVIVSEMRLKAAKSDPVAQRLLTNLVSKLASGRE